MGMQNGYNLKTVKPENNGIIRFILSADMDADTLSVVSDYSSEWTSSTSGNAEALSLSNSFRRYLVGDCCHPDDRKKVNELSDLILWRNVFEDNEDAVMRFEFRRKQKVTDDTYRTMQLEVYSNKSAGDSLKLTIIVRELTDNIEKKSVRDSVRHSLLIVGKQNRIQDLIKILENDFELYKADSSEEGVHLLRSHASVISLVLVTDYMAQADEHTFIKTMRLEGFLPKIPVLVITDNEDEIDAEKILSLGATDFLEKPYRSNLAQKLKNLIQFGESSELIDAVEFDELTGVYTRQAFCHYAENLLKRNPDKQYDLLISDIEDFKVINDRYGTHVGDQILRDVGRVLRPAMEHGVLIGRYAGDQFVSFMEHAVGNSPEMFLAMSKAIGDQRPFHNMITKFGVYENVDHNASASVLCDRAMMALRTIKHQYGVDYAFFDENLLKKVIQQQNIELDMHTALKEEQFKVYYQPKHDAKTGAIVGAEALIRWIHPKYGFMSPGEFVPLFEKNGFITRTDAFVWRKTCENLRKWIDMGLRVVPISVNASKLDFKEAGFWEGLTKPIEENRISPEFLHIEVTESLFSENVTELIKTLKNCRAAGFKVELDDFGAGYSSLNTLGTLPLDVVKLEMSFMKQIHEERRLRVLSACVNLAKSLSLRTVVEGVESNDQMDIVRNMGVDVIQGYYFSKPIPAEEFEEYLTSHPVQSAENTEDKENSGANESGTYVLDAELRVVSYNGTAKEIYPDLEVGHLISEVMEEGGKQNPHEVNEQCYCGPHIVWNPLRNMYETVDMTAVEIGNIGKCTIVNFSTVGEEATFAKKYREQEIRAQQLKMIQALSEDYNDVYTLDLKTGRVEIHRFSGNAAGVKAKLSQGLGYREAIDAYIELNLYREDAESFREATRLSNVQKELMDKKSFTYNYRVYRNGEIKYFRARYTKLEESDVADSMVIAFADVDRETKKLLAEQKLMQENVDIIRAFADIYYCAYYIDIKANTYSEISSRIAIRDLVGTVGECQSSLDLSVEKLISEEYRNRMHSFNDMSKWALRLQDKDVISQRFEGFHEGRSRANIIVAKRDENGCVTHVIYCMRGVNPEDFEQA